MNLSIGMTAPSSATVLCGSTSGSGCWVVPKASSIAASATSSTPSEETSFASGAAVRSGRNTTSSIAAPTASTNSKLVTSAGAVPICTPSTLVRNDQNAYPASIAMAPVARLMIPDPR
jgi:hypothetical protein